MKIKSIPKPGRKGDVVYYKGRTGYIKRIHSEQRNPRSTAQEAHRKNVREVAKRWGTLSAVQKKAWRFGAAENELITETGSRVRYSGYHFFLRINTRRADLHLPQFDLPPARPFFPRNPVTELAITITGASIAIKLRVTGPGAQCILVCGPAPKRSGIRVVQHFPFLILLPAPEEGWSDITEIYVARYGVPKGNTRIWIRVFQHIDGWIDEAKVVKALVPA